MKVHTYDKRFIRNEFDCGKESLNNYIRKNATKDVKSGACTCFVILSDQDKVIGYYTLSTESIPKKDAPPEFQKKIKYNYIPVILLGRLAIDSHYSGSGLGKFLLVNALKKSLDVAINHIGAVAVVVDPIDKEAESFYSKYGFIKLPDSGRMFMSIRQIKSAFEQQ